MSEKTVGVTEKPQDAFKETKLHGRLDFPYTVYIGVIPDSLTSFPLHWHEEFEIIYINSGYGTIFVDTQNYDCCYGDIFIIPPGTIHGINQKNNERMVYFNILFKPSLFETDETSLFYKNYCEPLEDGTLLPPFFLTPDTAESKIMRPHLERLTEKWQVPPQENLLFIKTRMYAIFEQIYQMAERELQSEIQNGSQRGARGDVNGPQHGIRGLRRDIRSGVRRRTASARFKPLFSYINSNYDEAISVEQAAELCNYSASFFMKTFKNTFGTTFNSYLNEFRLEKAQNMLKTTDMNVTQVSAACGFESLSYFIKCFREKWGVTPHSIKKSTFRGGKLFVVARNCSSVVEN